MDNGYQILIKKLDSFIRKYYKNLIIRGIILFLAISLLFFILVSIFEYFTYNSTTVRSILFYSYIAIVLLVLTILVIIPLLKLYRIGSIISYEQASDIIGKHFNEISDKLLNSLQLFSMHRGVQEESELVLASIEQKSEELQPIPFNRAIDLKGNIKYLKFALIPLLMIFITFLTAPSLVKDPTNRIINHDIEYKRPMPFEIQLLNSHLRGIKNEDFTIKVRISGESLPEKAYIEYQNSEMPILKKDKLNYQFTFSNLLHDISFRIVANGFSSEWYTIDVVSKPIILEFETQVDYPKYLNKKSDIYSNSGDLIIPEGSKIKWGFYTSNTSEMNFFLDKQKHLLHAENSNVFEFKHTAFRPFTYSVNYRNNDLSSVDTMTFNVQLIKDMFPEILVEETSDSLTSNILYFSGNLSDDYGLSKLTFNYRWIKTAKVQSDTLRDSTFIINTDYSSNMEKFYHYFDLATIAVPPGASIEYYFEVWDNDGIRGSKSTQSKKFIYQAPTEEELEKLIEENADQVESSLSNSIAQLREMQLEIDQISRKLIEKDKLSWQDEEQIKELIKKHKSIEDQIKEMVQENEKIKADEQNFKKVNENILEKQAELQKLFENLMDEDMKKLFEELEKLLEQNNKEKLNDLLQEMKMTEEELEKELDRNLELFKQLEFEKEYQETIDELNKLAKEQEKNAENTENKSVDKEDLLQKEKQIQESFKKIEEKVDELKKENSSLESPMNMEDTEPQQQDIEQDIEESLDMLNKGQSKKSSKSQKNASEKMKSLAEKMEQMMADSQMEQQAEDIKVLREILENLIVSSFEQENLINELNLIDKNDPLYKVIVSDQRKLIDDVQLIEDSLLALAKRQPSIKQLIHKEVNQIQFSLKNSVDALSYYRGKEVVNKTYKETASKHQQQSMTSMNNLALLLSEVLDQMMQDQNSKKGKAGKNCKNPKPGQSGKMKSMRQLQEQLNKQIQSLKKGMKPNGQKMGKKEMSSGLAKMAAQQEALRRQLQQYGEELRKQDGVSDKQIEQIKQEMEKTEKDLVNKILSNETLKRQQDILSRMLESEKAENEREKDQKRKSKEAKSQKISNPFENNQYNNQMKRQRELLNRYPLHLKPFYKRKVDQYYLNLEQ